MLAYATYLHIDTYLQCERSVLPGASNGSVVLLDYVRPGGQQAASVDSPTGLDKAVRSSQCNAWDIVPAWGGPWQCHFQDTGIGSHRVYI